MENKSLSFRLFSSENEYIITLKLLNDIEPQKLEISLTHKLNTGNINFFLKSSREELIKENIFLSQFNSVEEIFDYFIRIIKSQKIKIFKPIINQRIFFYKIEFYDEETENYFYVLIPRDDNYKIKKYEELIEEQKKKIEAPEKESSIKKIDSIMEDGKCVGIDIEIKKSDISSSNFDKDII